MNRFASCAILSVIMTVSLAATLSAQEDAAGASATCNFDEDKQLVIQYQHVPINLKKPIQVQVPFGKVWAPGGKAMTMFTNTAVQIGSKELPIGAYTLFVIPNSKQWTLVVSKSTDTSGAYDQGQDLVRIPMDNGELPSPEPSLNVSFAHVSPQQCNIRIDLDKLGHFAEFKQR